MPLPKWTKKLNPDKHPFLRKGKLVSVPTKDFKHCTWMKQKEAEEYWMNEYKEELPWPNHKLPYQRNVYRLLITMKQIKAMERKGKPVKLANVHQHNVQTIKDEWDWFHPWHDHLAHTGTGEDLYMTEKNYLKCLEWERRRLIPETWVSANPKSYKKGKS